MMDDQRCVRVSDRGVVNGWDLLKNGYLTRQPPAAHVYCVGGISNTGTCLFHNSFKSSFLQPPMLSSNDVLTLTGMFYTISGLATSIFPRAYNVENAGMAAIQPPELKRIRFGVFSIDSLLTPTGCIYYCAVANLNGKETVTRQSTGELLRVIWQKNTNHGILNPFERAEHQLKSEAFQADMTRAVQKCNNLLA